MDKALNLVVWGALHQSVSLERVRIFFQARGGGLTKPHLLKEKYIALNLI